MAKQGMKRFCPEHRKKDASQAPRIDNDLALENLENDWDMTAADRQDLRGQ